MKSFLIKELEHELEFDEFDFNVDGFVYKTKKPNIKEITIVNSDIIFGLISYNFNKKYKKILELILSSENDEESSGNLRIALDEIARLKNIIETKYHIYLKSDAEAKLIKKLVMLQKDIKIKLVDIEIKKEEKMNIRGNHKGKSR